MKRWVLIGAPSLLLVSLIAWRFQGEKAAQAELDKQSQARRGSSPSVEVAVIGRRPLEQRLEAIGTLESLNTVRVSPKVSGRIEQVLVREGDSVTPGQVLVQMDTNELQAVVLQQQANVSAARARLAEAEVGSGSTDVGVVSVIAREQASVNSAQADYNQASKTVEAQVASEEANVEDAQAKVAAAQAGVKNADAELVAANAELKNAETKLARAEALYEKGYVAGREVDDARTAADTARAQVGVRRGERDAAELAVTSARAQQKAAEKQLAIAKQRGTAGIAAAKARLEQAKAALNVARANRSQSSAYRANLTALRANVAAAEAQLRAASTRLLDAKLTSPVAGKVTARTADAGSVASQGEPVLTIETLTNLYVKVSIPVDEAAAVRVGQGVEISLDAFPEEKFEGLITEVNPSADLRTRQFVVRAKIGNPGERLRPGMFARVSLLTNVSEPRVVVPREALRSEGGEHTVFVVDGEGKVSAKKIEVGGADDDGFEVISGLAEGERAVILSYNSVRDGQSVKVTAEVDPSGKRTEIAPKGAEKAKGK